MTHSSLERKGEGDPICPHSLSPGLGWLGPPSPAGSAQGPNAGTMEVLWVTQTDEECPSPIIADKENLLTCARNYRQKPPRRLRTSFMYTVRALHECLQAGSPPGFRIIRKLIIDIKTCPWCKPGLIICQASACSASTEQRQCWALVPGVGTSAPEVKRPRCSH